jgi:hypothetical protein
MMRQILTAFSVVLVGVGILLPVPAIGTPPVPCTNLPFDFAGTGGKQIRATGGIDLYNDAFVCPRDVTVSGSCIAESRSPEKETAVKEKGARPRMIAEEDAEEIVWNLPEVKAIANRLRGTDANPFAMITGYPAPEAKPGDPSAAYEVYVGENHGTHTVRAITFLVDAYYGKVSVYDEAADRIIPLEEYRKQVRK